MKRMSALLLSSLSLLLVAACTSGPEKREITVFAAASLKDAFTELEKSFEASHPGADVRISFGGSSDLAQQIVNGAPADVFASASPSTMDTVAKADLIEGRAEVFAVNTLRIAVPPGNPKGIKALADLTKPGTALVLCAPQVPCGAAAKQVATAAKLTLKPVSEEPDVRSVLGKVSAKEADAGLVYVTDVLSAPGKVEGIDFPESADAVNEYPLALLKKSKQAQLAREFAELVRGQAGRDVLTRAGFGPP
ncbi:molybdate ABC transporter substrate-binding protein [Allokutzneria multivorans]|uniref:Molybdate ABC transporter substrate-binding protein n=1 Tax=Allokutzneria multivorans TaxID=1142134 RepID=A0ABP7R7F6_9PSEU